MDETASEKISDAVSAIQGTKVRYKYISILMQDFGTR